VFGRKHTLAIRSEVALATAKVGVGHNMSVVMYWDKDEAIDYIRFDEHGWSELRSLGLDELVSRDRAIELIQKLSH